MNITEETLSDLTSRVRQAYHPCFRDNVNNSWVVSQLENIDGMPFISLSRQYTYSRRDLVLGLKSLSRELTQEYLRELLHYEPDDGTFKWKVSKGTKKVGDVAGSIGKYGCRRIRIDGEDYSVHTLAFLYMSGEFPIKHCNHLNHNRLDNRWVNLRKASQKENQSITTEEK